MGGTPFLKMHGLGNDFVILDGRKQALELPLERRRSIAHRQLGIGCDQLIVLEPPTDRDADIFMRIYNPDGSEAGACGNATLFVANLPAIKLEELGPQLEHDPFFPERANIGVAEMVGENRLKLRVWERGTGLTLACGSGACAAGVAAARRGLAGRQVEVMVEHGTLTIDWMRDDHVMMTGGISLSYKGEL